MGICLSEQGKCKLGKENAKDPLHNQAPFSSAQSCRLLNDSTYKIEYRIRPNHDESESIWKKRDDPKDRLPTKIGNREEVCRVTVLEEFDNYDDIGETNTEEKAIVHYLSVRQEETKNQRPITAVDDVDTDMYEIPVPPLPVRVKNSKNQPPVTPVDDAETRIYELPPPPVPSRTETVNQPPAISVPPCAENSKNEPTVTNVGLKQKEKTHRYEQAVFLFERLIINTVNVKQILPYLHTCIKRSEREQLRRISESENTLAATKLLEFLKSSDEPGKWKALVEALEKTGNKLLVDVMRQLTVADNEEQNKILNLVTLELRQQILPTELIPFLKAHEIITGEDAEEILAKERNYGCIAAADLLIECIPKKHPEWFDRLLLAFSECGRHDLKDILELGIISEKNINSDALKALKNVSNKRKMSETSTLTNSFTVVNSDKTGGEKKIEYEEREDTEQKKNIFDEDQEDKTSLKKCDHVESATRESNWEAANLNDTGKDREYSNDTKRRENESTNQHVADKHDGTTSEATATSFKQMETREQKPNNEHKNLPNPTQKINYTSVVFNGELCIAEVTKENGGKPDQLCVEDNVNKADPEYVPESIRELRKLREDSFNEIQMLKLEINERKVISEAFDRKNELLREKRILLDSFAIQSKEEAALKAAMSEDKAHRAERSSTIVDDINIYMYRSPRYSPGKFTIDFRNNDMIIFDGNLYQNENDQVVKIFDTASSSKDSAFYSDENYYDQYWHEDRKHVKPIPFQ